MIMKKVLITGKSGQLGNELLETLPENIEVLAFDRDLDICDKQALINVFNQFLPDVVINAAAYTAVDKAESEPDLAYSINEQGVRNIAELCAEFGAKMVHVSTDFVFDGTQTTPYTSASIPSPINVYGASKLAGELAVNQVLGGSSIIIRTAWVYSVYGSNFVKTMLKLMSDKPRLGIVYDQVGTPTWAKGLAKMIWALLCRDWPECENARILNWTDAGVASWYDFAVAIQDIGLENGLLQKDIPLSAIPASAYPTPAKRPSFSVIDKAEAEQYSGVVTVHWRKQLALMMTELKQLNG